MKIKLKVIPVLVAMISLGAVFAGALSYGEEAAEGSKARAHGSESRKAPGDAGMKAAGGYDGEAGMPPKAIARKRGIHPGQTQHKPGKVVLSHPEVKKKRDDHPPTVA